MEEQHVGEQPGSARRPRLRLPVWVGTTAVVVGALVVVALLVSRLSGGSRECPAIAYSSLLEVVLSGDTAAVAHLQLRDGDDEEWPPLPTGPDTAERADPTSRDGDTWTLTLFGPTNPIGLRALDDDGNVLAQTERTVEMVRVGGSAACGGPLEGRIGWTL
ncbi:hypothetical protein JN535_14260 [Cellulosimicrobium cellulans]|uniref:hypothetical protein n=1 Tax=Cellulosimicrobium cellulans TaxID=1710 RepID=UPI00196555BA|nr:hypothetical protein [Cellulosimicrobium cellulans]MBN0041327.1 hypothetical protein [Cellulosimicrobium cellulans]